MDKPINSILTCFDLKQHVHFPAHVHGHWLDLLMTKRTSNSIKAAFSAAGISDHLAVISEIYGCDKKLYKENEKKIVDFPRLNPSLTCIGRMRAL